VVLVTGCSSLPVDYPRTESHAYVDTSGMRLGRAATPLVDQHSGAWLRFKVWFLSLLPIEPLL
jgi:hypothetical protein